MKNRLDQLFERAMLDPHEWLQFYSIMLVSDLWMPVSPEAEIRIENGVITFDMPVWNGDTTRPFVPVFTSDKLLAETTTWPHQAIGIAADVIFTNCLGRSIVLNPASQFPKLLRPEEIACLIGDSIGLPPAVHLEPGDRLLPVTSEAPLSTCRHLLGSVLAASPSVRAAHLFDVERPLPLAMYPLIVLVFEDLTTRDHVIRHANLILLHAFNSSNVLLIARLPGEIDAVPFYVRQIGAEHNV
jgi:hypothetical protein